MISLEHILEDVRRVIPQVWGIAVVDGDGLPIDFILKKNIPIDDPIILGGILSSAAELMKNLMSEMGNSSMELIFSRGNRLTMIIGKVKEGYFVLLAEPDVELGPLLLKFKTHIRNVERALSTLF